jgi:hypothetical protein
MGNDQKQIHIGYVIEAIDATNYRIKVNFFDDNKNLLKELSKTIPMNDFNESLIYTEAEHKIKKDAEEIVKQSMYKSIINIFEQDIRITSSLLKLSS